MEKLAASAIQIESMPKHTINTKPMMEEVPSIPDAVNDRVRIVNIQDYKEAARCLAESFLNDDVSQYFLHNKEGNFKGWTEESRKLHDQIYEYITYAHCLKGLVTTIGPNFDSVALWYIPKLSFLCYTLTKVVATSGCRLARIWMTTGPSSDRECGG